MASRYFALIPAAGRSSRMGEPKLLLPLAGRPMIVHTIEAWRRSGVDHIVVVVRPGDAALAESIRGHVESNEQSPKSRGSAPGAVELVIPDVAPVDMKASLRAAVGHIQRCHAPGEVDAFLVAPADMPRLVAEIIDRLIERHRASAKKDILVPTIGGRRGHPVLFPWAYAAELVGLDENEGLNAIVERSSVLSVPCEDLVLGDEYPFADVDTPEEYEKMTNDQALRDE